MKQAPGDSAIMLAVMGILAYAASMLTHEALGHGIYCLAVGGHNVMLTAWQETCDFPAVHPSGIEAAGPGVQFGAGLLAWLILRLLSPNVTRLRYFFWLYMVFCLLIASGYIAFSGVTNFGDAAVLIAGLYPPLAWRGALVLLGSVVYFLSMRAAALELKRFAGLDDRSSRLFRLVWVPYVTTGVFACCTAALNRTMGHGTALGLAVASSCGGAFGILRLPDMQRGMETQPGMDMQRGMASKPLTSPAYLTWSAAWAVAAALVLAIFLFFIGPGLD